MKKKTILALLAGLLVISLAASLLVRKDAEPGEPVQEQTETLISEKVPGALDTPFGTLYYPEEWEEYLQITSWEAPYTLSFVACMDETAEEISLFTLGLGENAGEYVGQCLLADGSTASLYLAAPAFAPAEEQGDVAEKIFAMQDMINQLLEQIEMLPDIQETEPGEKTDEVFYGIATVDTPYGQLCYSAQWKDCLHILQTEGTPYVVAFRGILENGVELPLFDVSFEPDEKENAMAVQAPDGSLWAVTITVHPINVQGLTQEQQDQILEMQETANIVLDKLSCILPDNEVPEETQGNADSLGKTLAVQTPYGMFYLEGEWDGTFRLEYAEGGQQLLFYGMVPPHEEQLLFCFDFSQNTVDPISAEEWGYSLEISQLEFDNQWSELQIDQICSMQEYANDLMQLIKTAKS